MDFSQFGEIGPFVGLALNVAYGLMIFAVAMFASGLVARRIRQFGDKRTKLDPTLTRFLASFVRYAILVFAGMAVLSRLGIQTTSLAALIGAAGLAIGLALQGTLSHLASGVMLIFFRPFKVGDFVRIAGEAGTVDEISLISTRLITTDNMVVIVPNGDVYSGVITNLSTMPTRRCDIVFPVSYSTDLKHAEEVIWKVVGSDERVLKDPEPFVRVTNLGDYSVDFTVRLWCATADLWNLRFATIRAVKEAFDAEGVAIPFPTAIRIEKGS
ncbi:MULTISPECIES: mechanosensitive ion channel family protein [unclassified Ruegeria]|uniref:mechanosensitive ion channel family protein n=1 Tax=unclassified Ruegeria TaxID=2625375 RepID=UPI00209D86AA|nr:MULTISPECIES: mechanosensitive ion channel domain-containing protein [unclassified Ruegeria]